MNIFLTGASGYIGGSLALDLIAKGHHVRGLVRGEDKVARLAALGIEPVLGQLDDSALLEAEAHRADAVINTASSDHRAAIEALIAGLAGSGKPLLHTSGSSVIGDHVGGDVLSEAIFDEDTLFIIEPEKQARAAIDRRVLDAASQGIRSVVLCHSMIYGQGRGLSPYSVQIPPLVAQARKSGVARHVGQGVNRWSNVHLDDVIVLYELALEKAPGGSFYFVENGEASFAQIVTAIAQRLRLGAPQAWSVDAAAAEWGRGHAVYSFGSNSRVRAKRARAELGWAPRHDSVTRWITDEMPLD